MEIHSHAHSPRKKWTHYFWEFLMLFLAVFCGFLAENKREHIVESHRAKEYAKSLLSELREDTAELRQGLHQTIFIIACFDSVLSISSRYTRDRGMPGAFYYYSRFTSNAFLIDWSRSTLTQLIQSGSLRYIKDKELVNKVNRYYAKQDVISSHNQTDRDHRFKIMELRNHILQAQYYSIFSSLNISLEVYGHAPSDQIAALMKRQLPLQEGAEKIMDDYLNHLSDRKLRNLSLTKDHYPKAIEMAEEIISILKTEYHFK